MEAMPSSDRLFWMFRWPAPKKFPAAVAVLCPATPVVPARTPAVVVARFQTFRPLPTGSSWTLRSPMVSERAALSVSRAAPVAATVTVSVTPPTCRVAFVRTTLLVGTSMPVALNAWKPEAETVISYRPVRTNWML